MNQLVECVPNFSEGRDQTVMDAITASIIAVKDVTLLDVDSGDATNRTVVTFIGTPENVIDAAFNAIKTASTLINMKNHKKIVKYYIIRITLMVKAMNNASILL